MTSAIYWIDCRDGLKLGIMARPRAGDWLEDEIDNWRREGVELVVSLLEPAEVSELGLDDEPRLCRERGIEFISFPIPDRGVPGNQTAAVRVAGSFRTAGKVVAIHCRAGIGRSSLLAATALVLGGMEAEPAFALIEQARGLRVPDTEAQRAWVASLSDLRLDV